MENNDKTQYSSESDLKVKKVLKSLDDLENDMPIMMSSFLDNRTKKKSSTEDGEDDKESKKKKKKRDPIFGDDTEWFESVNFFKSSDVKKNKNSNASFDDLFKTGGRKKKKKKKKGEGKDYRHEFEPEMMLYRSMLVEHNKFSDTLLKKYYQLENTKSSNRGVGKYTTDLINAITTNKSFGLSLVDKMTGVKKTIADLEFKERKEFGTKADAATNMNDYASNLLNEMVGRGRNNIVSSSGGMSMSSINNIGTEIEYDDSFDDEALSASISDSLSDLSSDNEVDLYLKYENSNVEIVVEYDNSIDSTNILDKFDFVAYSEDGDMIEDYPLPRKTSMTINESTMIGIDMYGNKYRVVEV